MWRSVFIYNFIFIQQIPECLHHISVLRNGDVMSHSPFPQRKKYSPFPQGVYSLVETKDE